jgi:hypothetical protein
MYGIAYNQGNPKTDLAVPIRTTCQFDFEIPRNTVAEVYELMEKDLLTAIDLLEKNPIVTTTFRIQAPAAKAILARIYLYQERWDDAIKYSKEALAKKSTLLHFGQLDIPEREPGPGRCWEHWSWDCYQLAWQIDTWRIYGDNYYRTESLWVRQAPSNTVETSYIGNAFGPYCMSKEVIANYGEKTGSEDYHKKEGGDLRGLLFFSWYNVPATHVLKDEEQIDINKGSYKYDRHQGIRTAELYLNLAEAYAQKYANGGTTTDRDAVIENLNTLRQHRFTEAAWEELGKVEAADFASAQELLEFCVAERWRELCGETNHRYCDLRRYGMTVTHKDNLGGGTYTQNMAQFVLPIPQAVLESDLSLKDNY